MQDPRIEKLADLLVDYSVAVTPGDKVMVNCIGFNTEPLARALVPRILAKGGIPFCVVDHAPLLRDLAIGASEQQMKDFAAVQKSFMEQMQCYIGVRGSENQFEMSDVPADKKIGRAHV